MLVNSQTLLISGLGLAPGLTKYPRTGQDWNEDSLDEECDGLRYSQLIVFTQGGGVILARRGRVIHLSCL